MTSLVLYLSGISLGACAMAILLFSYVKRKTDEAFEEGYEFGYKVGVSKGENDDT